MEFIFWKMFESSQNNNFQKSCLKKCLCLKEGQIRTKILGIFFYIYLYKCTHTHSIHEFALSASMWKEILHYEGSEALEQQVAQRNCGCPLPGGVQVQAGWGFEQPGLVEGVPAHSRWVGTRRSLRSLPTQTILWFYDSV